MARLGDVCTRITDGSHNPPSGVTHSEYLMLSSKNVTDDAITTENPRFLSKAEFELENRRTQVQHGDLLMTIVGTVGRVAVVPEELQGICLQRSVAVLKPKHELITPRYLMYQLQSMQSFLEQEAHGVAQKGIYLKQVEQLDIRVLEMAEQKKIVEHLDKVSALISLRKQQIAKLDELVKARFVEMFGDCTNIVLLSDVAEVSGGLTKNSKRDSLPLHMPYLRVANVSFATVDVTEMFEIGLTEDEYEKTRLCDGDLLFVEGNGSPDQIGRVAVWHNEISPCVHQNHLIKARFRHNEVLPVYAMHYFMTQQGRMQIKSKAVSTSGLYTLSVTKIESLELPKPSLELQHQFAAFVSQTDQQKLTIQHSLAQLELLKKALMQKYFG